MAAGDVYSQAARLPLWVAPGTAVSGNMPVLTDYSGIPAWTSAAAAVAANANVLTESDTLHPIWAPLAPTLTWTIQLVAGGTTQASFTGGPHGDLLAPVDGPLGTNTLCGPSVMSLAPDGKLWFLDGTTGAIRTYDPATGLVASIFGVGAASNPGLGEMGLAIDNDGNVWVYYLVDDDIPFAAIEARTADGTTFLGGAEDGSRGGPLPGTPSALAFSPDCTRIYYGAGRGGSSGIRYLSVADVLSGDFVTTDTGLADAPASTIGVSTDADGNVYSVGYEQGGAVKVTPGGVVTNLTNIASGQGYSGDGLTAFVSGDDTPQLAHPLAIAYDPVSGVVAIVDHDNFVIRTVSTRDGTGILATIAGFPGLSGSGLGEFPDATPAPALTKGLGGSINSIIAAPDGGFYVSTGTDFDDFGVDGIWGIYLLSPS